MWRLYHIARLRVNFVDPLLYPRLERAGYAEAFSRSNLKGVPAYVVAWSHRWVTLESEMVLFSAIILGTFALTNITNNRNEKQEHPDRNRFWILLEPDLLLVGRGGASHANSAPVRACLATKAAGSRQNHLRDGYNPAMPFSCIPVATRDSGDLATRLFPGWSCPGSFPSPLDIA